MEVMDTSEIVEDRFIRMPSDYYKHVTISAVALMKMVSHAEFGGNIEIMGLLQGRVEGNSFIIVDCFRLPVEGTETRVNAGEAANEYMIQYTELNELTRFSNDLVVGWYHSHPGYGCWLSGIDVATQALYQEHQDPFLAIVIDPLRTKETGRVEIGAFRTFPQGVFREDNTLYSSIPADRVGEFGVYCGKYYSLDIRPSSDVCEKKALASIQKEHWVDLLVKTPEDKAETRRKRIYMIEKSLKEAKQAAATGNKISEEAHNNLCACSRLYRAAQEIVRHKFIAKLKNNTTLLEAGMPIR